MMSRKVLVTFKVMVQDASGRQSNPSGTEQSMELKIPEFMLDKLDLVPILAELLKAARKMCLR